MYSHSILAEAEYNRNKAYNDSHFSAKVELAVATYLTPEQIMEYFNYVDTSNKD